MDSPRPTTTPTQDASQDHNMVTVSPLPTENRRDRLKGNQSPIIFSICPGTSIMTDEEEARHNRRKLIIASLLCLLFMVIEVVGGIVSGSLAIITDAAHLFSDIAGFLISLIALFIAKKPATGSLSFGFHRAEVIGAIFSVSLIWSITILMIYEAIERIRHPTPIVGHTMLMFAIAGLVVNIVMAFTLHENLHDHHHKKTTRSDGESSYEPLTNSSHSAPSSPTRPILQSRTASSSKHDIEAPASKEPFRRSSFSSSTSSSSSSTSILSSIMVKKRRSNLNIRAAFIHVIGDILQSVGVVVAAILIYFKPAWTLADPICSFLFAIIILLTTYKLLREAIHVLMEGTPTDIDPLALKRDLLRIEHVLAVHDLHIWSISPGKLAATMHVVISCHDHRIPQTGTELARTAIRSDAISPESAACFSLHYRTVLSSCQKLVCNKYLIHHSTIQIDSEDDVNPHCSPPLCSNHGGSLTPL